MELNPVMIEVYHWGHADSIGKRIVRSMGNDEATYLLIWLRQVMFDPPHVPQQLADHPVVCPRYLQLDHDEVAAFINGQYIDEPPPAWVLDPGDPVVLSEDPFVVAVDALITADWYPPEGRVGTSTYTLVVEDGGLKVQEHR